MIGIDLGTTYSLVAVLEAGQPIIIANALGEQLTPSAVSVDEAGMVLVGAPAAARAKTHPDRTATQFKRDMGTDRKFQLGPRTLGPQQLSALVLAELKRDAEAWLGRPVTEAVITVPAYFGDPQRQATKDAGELAGLRVERIINEPTAAAMAYGLHNRHRELKAVVLDLGGGTFDVTVLEIIEGVIEVQASAGDARLGGEDFTDALMVLIEQQLARQGEDVSGVPLARARIREACELAKRRLSTDESAEVALPGLPLAGGRRADVAMTITRQDAQDVWAPLLDRIRIPVMRALRDARVKTTEIDEVLLVGGSTRTPAVVELAARLFGRMPLRKLPPDEAVVMGAAIQAALKRDDEAVDDMVVTDVAPFTLGISIAQPIGGQRISGLFSPILERGTVIPASRVERFSTIEDGQREILIQVYQGEHSLCADNTHLGGYSLKGLPKAKAGEVSVDVRFTYDQNGILEVEMTVVGTERKEYLVLEQRPGKMTPEQLAQARAEMESLKFHPRDTLPNRTALDRAEALFVELTGMDRQALGALMARFRGALETQDLALIDEAREALNSAAARMRR
ncbi:MAG: Hsp70 family protein [Myxococcales bacterium]|nr:Hsp70 family protein [Myxococcales bacterium]